MQLWLCVPPSLRPPKDMSTSCCPPTQPDLVILRWFSTEIRVWPFSLRVCSCAQARVSTCVAERVSTSVPTVLIYLFICLFVGSIGMMKCFWRNEKRTEPLWRACSHVSMKEGKEDRERRNGCGRVSKVRGSRGRMTEKGVGREERRCSEEWGTVTHTDRLCSQLIGRGACQSEELGLGRCLKSRLWSGAQPAAVSSYCLNGCTRIPPLLPRLAVRSQPAWALVPRRRSTARTYLWRSAWDLGQEVNPSLRLWTEEGCRGGGGVHGDACRDAEMLMCSLRVVFVAPLFLLCNAFGHFTLGMPQIMGSGSVGVPERAEVRGFVCLSVGDCIRRCSSITDGAVVSVQ